MGAWPVAVLTGVPAAKQHGAQRAGTSGKPAGAIAEGVSAEEATAGIPPFAPSESAPVNEVLPECRRESGESGQLARAREYRGEAA